MSFLYYAEYKEFDDVFRLSVSGFPDSVAYGVVGKDDPSQLAQDLLLVGIESCIRNREAIPCPSHEPDGVYYSVCLKKEKVIEIINSLILDLRNPKNTIVVNKEEIAEDQQKNFSFSVAKINIQGLTNIATEKMAEDDAKKFVVKGSMVSDEFVNSNEAKKDSIGGFKGVIEKIYELAFRQYSIKIKQKIIGRSMHAPVLGVLDNLEEKDNQASFAMLCRGVQPDRSWLVVPTFGSSGKAGDAVYHEHEGKATDIDMVVMDRNFREFLAWSCEVQHKTKKLHKSPHSLGKPLASSDCKSPMQLYESLSTNAG
ncbi:hypothetical protein [Azospirillum brasilense]|uniref:hypothetical protein n=1 Tax=Azospirillum brasilense TaxID=192 RepID=UPI0013B3C310|nr:hypothetical protein [Azospirillum brasilense]